MDLMNAREREGRFATTRWSRVAAACAPDGQMARAELERLCQEYWPPLFAYALRKGHDAHSAQDLAQSFFAHFLERDYLRAANPERGRFRTFLLTCFQHFIVHEWEKSRALKRGGQFPLVSYELHRASLEGRLADEQLAPERLYDREWAFTLMARALSALRDLPRGEAETKQFAVLEQFLVAEPQPGDYREVASQLRVEERAVRVLVHRLRRSYGELVREEVRETLADERDLEDELRYLIHLVSA